MTNHEDETVRTYIPVEALEAGERYTYPEIGEGYWTVEVLPEKRLTNFRAEERPEAVVTQYSLEADEEQRVIGLLLGKAISVPFEDKMMISISEFIPSDGQPFESLVLEIIDDAGYPQLVYLCPISGELSE